MVLNPNKALDYLDYRTVVKLPDNPNSEGFYQVFAQSKQTRLNISKTRGNPAVLMTASISAHKNWPQQNVSIA